MERVPASERTREQLRALLDGKTESSDTKSELVRLAAQLILEEGTEGEATDALGRGYYERGAKPGSGYRNGYRVGRLKTAEGMVAFNVPQIAGRAEPFRSRIPRDHCRSQRGAGIAGGGDVRARALDPRHRGAIRRRRRRSTRSWSRWPCRSSPATR